MAKVNFLNNKDILKEIHKSKNTYCYFETAEVENYDIIAQELKSITTALINETAEIVADRLRVSQRDPETGRLPTERIDPDSLDPKTFIFRVMTFDHVPTNTERKQTQKTQADRHDKCNFPPFKHYMIESYTKTRKKTYKDIVFREVGRSHWQGSISNGHFSIDHGKLTNTLARMFLKLVDKYGQKGNWRSYSYVDEMKASSLLQLTVVGLQFDESRSQNPFAYYTAIMSNSFTRIFNMEKKGQVIRDELMLMHGHAPSHTMMVENQLKNQEDR